MNILADELVKETSLIHYAPYKYISVNLFTDLVI